MKFLNVIQTRLENEYGAFTGLNILDFVRWAPRVPGLGKLLIEQNSSADDLNVALLLDRDILEAWSSGVATSGVATSGVVATAAVLTSGDHIPDSPAASITATGVAAPAVRSLSVPFEEVSHFVYLSFNHNRGRNITTLEMEMQSEVDRILLAFHGGFDLSDVTRDQLLQELMEREYPDPAYETARRAAADFLRRLAGGDPRAWTADEFRQLRQFFHSDLAEKMRISKS